jgi:dTDP-4-amino-4,6-dideoxygalactose transaminase
VREALPPQAVPLFLPVLVEDKFGTVEKLQAQGIDAIPFWGIHHAHLPHGEFPDTEFNVKHAIEIPIHQDLNEEHMARIRDALVNTGVWRDCPPEDVASAACAETTAL